MVNTSASISRHSSLAWPLFTWRFSVSWATRLRLGITATAWRLERTAGNLYGRGPHEASAIAIGRSGIVTMAL